MLSHRRGVVSGDHAIRTSLQPSSSLIILTDVRGREPWRKNMRCKMSGTPDMARLVETMTETSQQIVMMLFNNGMLPVMRPIEDVRMEVMPVSAHWAAAIALLVCAMIR